MLPGSKRLPLGRRFGRKPLEPFAVLFDQIHQPFDGFFLRYIEFHWFLAHVEIDLPRRATHVAKMGISHFPRAIDDATHDGDFDSFQVLGARFDTRGHRLEVE